MLSEEEPVVFCPLCNSTDVTQPVLSQMVETPVEDVTGKPWTLYGHNEMELSCLRCGYTEIIPKLR
jgi:hypothetical protein